MYMAPCLVAASAQLYHHEQCQDQDLRLLMIICVLAFFKLLMNKIPPNTIA
jgi:hypothetical protein